MNLVHDHKLLKIARESEENFVDAVINREISWDIINIILLYDYHHAFSKLIDQIDTMLVLHHIARSIIIEGAGFCMRVFEKKYGYNILLSESMWVDDYEIAKHCLENGADPSKKTNCGLPIIFFAGYDIFCLMLDYVDLSKINIADEPIIRNILLNISTRTDTKKTIKILKSKYEIEDDIFEKLDNIINRLKETLDDDTLELKKIVEQRLAVRD